MSFQNKKQKKNLYEEFHKKTTFQPRLISFKNFTYRTILESLVKNLPPPEDCVNVLDIGCGAGTISIFLANLGYKVKGIDISRKAINVCKKNAKQLIPKKELIKFERVEFPYYSSVELFDVALCFEVIEHLKNNKLAISKIYNLLKKGGLLLLSAPSENAPLRKIGYANNFDKEVGHIRRYTIKDLVYILETTGFEILEIRKVEGIIRNFLFVNKIAGQFIKFIKGPISDLVTFIDNLTIPLFGESDLLLVARKK